MLHEVLRTIAAGSVAAAIFACAGGSSSDGDRTDARVHFGSGDGPASPSVSCRGTITMTARASRKTRTAPRSSGVPAATWTSSDDTQATVDPAVSGVVHRRRQWLV